MNYDLTNMFGAEILDDSRQMLNDSDNELLDILECASMESFTDDIRFDAELTCDTEKDIYDITQEHFSVEGITDTIKNKGSRAISNFIVMGKKALNFLFGFVINLFKSSIDAKSVLKKVYEKAKSYDKKIDSLISKKFPDNFELESKDYAKRSNASLILLRSIISMVQDCVVVANENQDADPLHRGVILSLAFSDMIGSITDKESKTSPNDIIGEAAKSNGSVKEMKFYQKFGSMLKAGYEGVIGFAVKAAKGTGNVAGKVADATGEKAAEVKGNIKFSFKKDPSDLIKIMENRSTALKDLVDKYSAEPEARTVKASQLFPYFKNQLKLFMNIISQNKWDFQKGVKQLESLRVKSIKALEKVSMDGMSDKERERVETTIRNSMQLLSAMGKSIAAFTPLVKQILNNVKGDIDNLMTEIAKCGSKASKI